MIPMKSIIRLWGLCAGVFVSAFLMSAFVFPILNIPETLAYIVSSAVTVVYGFTHLGYLGFRYYVQPWLDDYVVKHEHNVTMQYNDKQLETRTWTTTQNKLDVKNVAGYLYEKKIPSRYRLEG